MGAYQYYSPYLAFVCACVGSQKRGTYVLPDHDSRIDVDTHQQVMATPEKRFLHQVRSMAFSEDGGLGCRDTDDVLQDME